jgi:hypothetical protein
MMTQTDPSSERPAFSGENETHPCALSGADRRDRIDPKGVIAESYRIDDIGAAECRSIFLDWVLSTDMPSGGPAAAIALLLKRHGGRHPEHPMTAVLRAGLEDAPRRMRRGGRSGRLAG